MQTTRSTSTRTRKRPASVASWCGCLLVIALAPTASLAQETCAVNVDNYTPNQYVLGTYSGADALCWAAYSTYTVPANYGDTWIGCNDGSSCRVKLPTEPGGCPLLDVPCNQWVDLYLDGNGNLQGCYASVNGCYDPGTMTVDANAVHIDFGSSSSGSGHSNNSSTTQEQQQQQQPPSLLRGGKLAQN
jgi:hypothetical protein